MKEKGLTLEELNDRGFEIRGEEAFRGWSGAGTSVHLYQCAFCKKWFEKVRSRGTNRVVCVSCSRKPDPSEFAALTDEYMAKRQAEWERKYPPIEGGPGLGELGE